MPAIAPACCRNSVSTPWRPSATCAPILELLPDGGVRLVTFEGGPARTPVDMDPEMARIGIALRPPRGPEGDRIGSVGVLARAPAEIKARLAAAFMAVGATEAVASTLSAVIAVPIESAGAPVGRLYCLRFDGSPRYSDDDFTTAETLASAAATLLDRREVNERLDASLARFEALFEQAPVALVLTSSGGTRYNAAAQALYGRSQAEIRRASPSRMRRRGCRPMRRRRMPNSGVSFTPASRCPPTAWRSCGPMVSDGSSREPRIPVSAWTAHPMVSWPS